MQSDRICSSVSCLQHNREGTVKNCITDRKDCGYNLKWYPTIVNGPISTICSSKEVVDYCSSEWSWFSPWQQKVGGSERRSGSSCLFLRLVIFLLTVLVVNSFVLISRRTAKDLKQAGSKTKQRTELPSSSSPASYTEHFQTIVSTKM